MKSSLPPKAALQEFLMQHRWRLLDSDYSPIELLNRQQIHCKLDTLLSSPAMSYKGSIQGKLPRLNGRNTTIWCPSWCMCTLLVHRATPYTAVLSVTSNHGGCQQWSPRSLAHEVSMFTSFQENLVYGIDTSTNYVLATGWKRTQIQENP